MALTRSGLLFKHQISCRRADGLYFDI